MRKIYKNKGVAVTHGYSVTHPSLYYLYFSMRSRCEKPTDQAYFRYGGRGINVSPEWSVPEAFCTWAVANGYSPALTLERLDNSKGYSPDNCAWVSRKAQARNRRSSRLVTFGGRTQPVAAWAEELGIRPATLSARVNRNAKAGNNVDIDRLFSKKMKPLPPLVTMNGVSKPLREWAKDAGVHYTTICHRISEGWPIADALTRKNDIGWRKGITSKPKATHCETSN